MFDYILEETLSADDRNDLPDSMYGLVYTDEDGKKIRKFPLNDKDHITQAVRFFNRAKGLSKEQKEELARNIVKRAKEEGMEWENWDVLKPYLDKSVKEYYGPDDTSGTSDFDECIDDDEYYGEADQALMNQIQKNENNIPILQLRTYAKKCLHEGKSYNGGDKAYIFECIKNDANNQDKRCHEYFFNLIKEIDKCIGDQDIRKFENRPQKWFRYEKLINKFFSSIGVQYAKDRVVTGINLRAHSLTFLEKEFVKFRYDPTTDILIHRTNKNGITFLKPSHASGDYMIYPKPRIYFTLEPRSKYAVKGAYGDCAYEPIINKPIDVFYDTESPSHMSINVSSDKYGKDVFINTYKPLGVKQITSDNIQEGFSESFTEMFGPVIQEAFDAITGEEIPIDKAYTLEEMKERTLSLDEVKSKDKDGLIPVKPPKVDEVYFGSPTNHMPEIDLNRPLFVTPYKGIASIFIWRDWGLQNRVPGGSYNHNYKEFVEFDESKMKNPLKEVHVYVEGAPFIEPFTVEQEGYIHCIKIKYYENDFYVKDWMSRGIEWLIANTDNMKVEFTRVIKVKVRYHVEGRPAPKGKDYGPKPGGILKFTHEIADEIHNKCERDEKEPTGNQNCLLCTWCAEACMRGHKMLPRAVYSPRDKALEITPGDIVGGIKKIQVGNFYDLLEHVRSANQPFARWYCHVNWNGSTGGHEFLIVKIDEDKFGIMDAQAGTVKPLQNEDFHFKDINWKNSYICRIDDKPFKYSVLEKINDETPLPFDLKKDTAYMLREGMITKEEAERELKRHETDAFYSALKKELNQSPIQESTTSDSLFSQLPKDLQSFLIKKDYSMLDKDDSYYYVEGHPVEEFWDDPELAGSSFYLEKDDPAYNCIVFSDENGNGLIWDPSDKWYYYIYHDWTDDDTGFLHRERLSSKSWTQIIDPAHSKSIKDLDEKRSEISKELTRLKANPIYSDIEYGATNSHFGKGFFKSDCSAMEKRWNAIGHEWCNAVEDFADKYKFSELSETIDIFANKTMSLFVPTIGSHVYDIEAYKEGAKHVIKAFQDVEKSLKESTIQEGLFFKKKEYTPTISDKFEEFTRAYNDPIFKSIIKDFKNMKSKDLKKYYDNRFPVNERDDWMKDNFDGTVVSFEKNIDSELVETDNRYNPIGYMFATVKNQDEWLSISMLDGCVYYCNIRDNSKVSSSFNEFLKSFNGVFDKYLKDSHIQEGAWNDIRNGVNPWSKKRVFHITKQGHLDGQIFKPRVPEYLDKYDPSKDKFEDVDNPRVCFSPSIEGALNAIMVTIGRWKTADKLRDWYVYIPEKPLKEYKYRTTKQLVDEKKVYDANVTNEIWIEEPVRLKQYGIIRIDQVSDKHIRKTVPTTTGFTGHRYRYDFKYHWLVKPKVIADVPYDYTPKSVCEDMVNELSGFKYGLGYDGSIHHGSSKDFDEKYRFESPEDFEKNGGGICFDYVEWEAGYLEAYGYTCRKFYISTDTKDGDTHTFILVDDGKGKFIYPEAAFKPMEGVYEVKSPEEAARKVMDHIFDINDNDKKYDEIKYYVWEYKGHPPYGSTMKETTEYFSKGEPFHEGVIKNNKRKD